LTKVITISLQLCLLISTLYAQPIDISQGDMDSFSRIDNRHASYLDELIYADPTFKPELEPAIKSEFDALIQRFDGKVGEDTLHFVYRMYSYIQRKELKQYKEHVSFHETILTDSYDCLTSSILLALVLDEIGIPFKAVEFNYHVALFIPLAHKNVMLDPADPHSGFLLNEKEIKDRINYYLSDEFNQLGDDQTGLSTNLSMKMIGLKELVALHYYNLAVDYYNQQRFIQAGSLAQKAYEHYPSARHRSLLEHVNSQEKIVASY
jgi:hypothetical protein